MHPVIIILFPETEIIIKRNCVKNVLKLLFFCVLNITMT